MKLVCNPIIDSYTKIYRYVCQHTTLKIKIKQIVVKKWYREIKIHSLNDLDSCLLFLFYAFSGTFLCIHVHIQPCVNTSGKAGAQIPHPPWEMMHPPGGDNAVCM
jgi:hypothetical protein